MVMSVIVLLDFGGVLVICNMGMFFCFSWEYEVLRWYSVRFVFVIVVNSSWLICVLVML